VCFFWFEEREWGRRVGVGRCFGGDMRRMGKKREIAYGFNVLAFCWFSRHRAYMAGKVVASWLTSEVAMRMSDRFGKSEVT
jgi:hypothetical protein